MKKSLSFAFMALLAAVLFGISAPLSKLLLGEMDPVFLSALLYLGSGFSLLLVRTFQRMGRASEITEAKIRGTDYIWLAGATLAGGVAAPIILLFSLRATPAATASLLLNFESVATALIAAVVFREAVSRRAWWAVGLITAASMLLSLDFGANWRFSVGSLGILAACFFWGIDNNLTRNISAKDPITIVVIKSLAAGTFSLVVALLFRDVQGRSLTVLLAALALGGVSYGVSILLFVRSLRGLGAARTSALFSTSPLSGLALSLILFPGGINPLIWLALPLMGLGTFLLVNEEHGHIHIHQRMVHDHAHSHEDKHHSHFHGDLVSGPFSHSHEHEHDQLEHDHSHMPDTHHRHTHNNEEE